MTHDVLDMFGKSRIVMVPENIIIPTCLNRQPVKVNIILENALIIPHIQVVNRVFSIRSRVDRTKLGAESMDQCGPIVQPFWGIIKPGKGWFEKIKSCTMKVSQRKSDLCIIIGIGWIFMEIQITKKEKTVKLTGLEPSKVSSSLALALPLLSSWRLSSLVIEEMASAKFGVF